MRSAATGETMNRKHKKILDSYLAGIPLSPSDTPWRPAADVVRTESGWLVKLELAGVDPGEVDVTLSGNLLQVKGLRRDSEVRADYHVHSMEISYNRFQRSIRLPTKFASADLRVESRHGMVLIWVLTKKKG
jgi:HSP20 family protein